MDIKLKKCNRLSVIRGILFFLTVIMLTTAVVLAERAVLQRNLDVLGEEDYKDTFEFNTLVGKTITEIMENDSEIPKTNQNYVYYLSWKDGTVSANVNRSKKEYFKNFSKAYLIYENQEYETSKKEGGIYWGIPFELSKDIDSLYFAFSNELIQEQQQEWESIRKEVTSVLVIIIILLLVSLFFIFVLIYLAGRAPEDEELHLTTMDRVYTDIQILIGGILGAIWTFYSYLWGEAFYSDWENINFQRAIYMGGSAIVTAIVIFLYGLILLSLSRKIKGRIFLKHSLVYLFCYGIYDFIKQLFDGRRFEKFPHTKQLFYKQMVYILASIVQVFLTLIFLMTSSGLFLLPILFELLITYWYIFSNNQIYEDINQGFDASTQEQLKSERMKVDLVTNVSHDLKTPLTSIISYVDLLEKEELTEAAVDYVKILQDKSQRLKKIVEDLFDLSKSTSGNLVLDLEEIDMKKLIQQTTADMEDRILQAGNKLVINLPDHVSKIWADGDKMYRVFQNVIDNALKYAMENTRIYITLQDESNMVLVSVKNIASYEMNFTSNEIVQRFNRGDEARTTEGSGLGLAIAESFTNACGGKLRVFIEGDVFEVRIWFPKKVG